MGQPGPARLRQADLADAVTYDEVRALALALPGVAEATSYGTPSLTVRGKMLTRLKEDGETLVIRIDFDEREMLIDAEPETFFVTDHYRAYEAMLVRLAHVAPETLQRLIEQAWRQRASRKQLAELERQSGA